MSLFKAAFSLGRFLASSPDHATRRAAVSTTVGTATTAPRRPSFLIVLLRALSAWGV
jgi:hypothetical protein